MQKLIGNAVEIELPQDDKMRKELMQSIYEDSQLLIQSEQKVLELLNNSRGVILDDIELIESLRVSKQITKAVNEKIKVSIKKEEQLQEGLITYHPVA